MYGGDATTSKITGSGYPYSVPETLKLKGQMNVEQLSATDLNGIPPSDIPFQSRIIVPPRRLDAVER
ncbi:conserved hypothetical protein [Uncinocarpus reesii 1704]|uniref:Uncharacterized protein n=1 Tax=Uncinocarpus reesii (strain UAMH 1704) TaxID=336963 RepID=C4JHF3_UNCRE|nr:uncharacterized protein UREG_01316 [Uncinocarpus reesii 1704]EEP76467.1 conserved hypothetical protein [Uncinocarpus reesii 1704]